MSARLVLVSATLCGLGAVAVSGCTSSDVTASATSELRADVLAVSRAVAAHDDAAALSQLQTLKDDLAQAKANGRVSAGRYSQITDAIDAVSGDLTAAGAGSTTDAPSSTAHASTAHITAPPTTGPPTTAPSSTRAPAAPVSGPQRPGPTKPAKTKDSGGKGHGG